MIFLRLVLAFCGLLFFDSCVDKNQKVHEMVENGNVTPGHVIVFDGASSSGKTSVIKQLKAMLDSSYECVAVDDFVAQAFREQQKLNLPEKDFFARINQQTDIMYEKIKALVLSGKNVILDTVLSGLEGEKSIQEQLGKLATLSTIKILVYCPLPVLVDRIIKRNEIAMLENKPEEERPVGTAIKQFGYIYRAKFHDDEISIGTLTRSDVVNVCEASKKEFTENLDKFDQFKEWLLSQLGVKDKDSVTLTTRLKYDCIIDTSKNINYTYIIDNCL